MASSLNSRLKETLPPLLLLVLASIAFWPDPTIAAHTPDAPDYALPSLNFLAGKGMVIIVDGSKLPPMHPFGLPLIMSVAYVLLGPHPGNGVYVVFLMALGSVLLLYHIGRRLFDARVAFLAALFLIVGSVFQWSAIIIRTEVPSVFFCLAVHALLLAALSKRESPRWLWFVLGQVFGFGLAIRWDNALLVLPAGVLALSQIRSQDKPVSKVLLAAGGVVLWGTAALYANYLYTGDWFRSQIAVTISGIYDRPGLVSWRNILAPTFRESNLARILQGGAGQWSLAEADSDKFKMFLYYGSWLFSLVAIIKLALNAKSDHKSRALLIWVGLLMLPMVFFYSCLFGLFDRRYMLRVVPYLCLLNALGMVTVWDIAPRLRRLPQSLSLVTVRGMVSFFVVGFAVYMFSHPFAEHPWAGIPTATYLQQIRQNFLEDDAVVISNFDAVYVEYFLVQDSHRRFLPLHRANMKIWLQWKKPPHPEWIVEDMPYFAGSDTYRRIADNGAQRAFPFNAMDNPEIIDEALNSGRRVYFLCAGVWTPEDYAAVTEFNRRYGFEIIEYRFRPPQRISQRSLNVLQAFSIFHVWPKGSKGSIFQVSPSGDVELQHDLHFFHKQYQVR